MAVSYNKMSAIQVAGTYVNNIASGTSLGNVSLDITGKSHFTSDMIVDGSFNILNINSSAPTSNFGVANNQTTGNINIGDALTTGTININSGASSTAPTNISNLTTLNAPITIGSTTSTTQTLDINAITTFSKIPSCSVAPTTSNHLCNKTYVDSAVGGSSILGTANAFTNTNTFNSFLPTSTLTPSSSTELTTKSYVDSAISTAQGGDAKLATANTFTNTNTFTKDTTTGLIKYNDKDAITRLNISGVRGNGLTLANASGGGGQQSNVNLNMATLTISANNTQSKVRVSMPIVLAAVGLPSIYSGTLTITYTDVYSITILKNGSAYETIYEWDKRNWTTDTRSWTGWSDKSKWASAYFGNIDFFIPLTTGNASTDTYTIGLAVTFSLNANSPYFIEQFVITGNPYYTTTHATNSTGTTYVGTDPSSFYGAQITMGDINGGYILATSLYLDAITNIDLKAYELELESRYGSITLNAGTNGGIGDILLKTNGTGDINIESSDINITGGNVSITNATIGGATISTSGSDTTITAATNMAVYGTTLSTLGWNGGSNTTLIDGFTIQMRSPVSPIYTGTPHGAQIAMIGSRVAVPFTSSTASAVTTIYTQTNFPIGVWIIEVKMTFSYASAPPAGAWYRIGTSGAAGSFNDPTRVMDYNPNSSGQQNVHFTTTYQFGGSSTFYVIQQHSGTTITTPTNGSYVMYTRIA